MAFESPLIDLFGRSPVKPLQEHIKISKAAADLLPSFLAQAMAGDWQQAETIRNQISSFEKDADRLKRDIRMNLPNSLFMPVSRQDLLELLLMQDRIANLAKKISGVMLGRMMTIPNDIGEEFQAYLGQCIEVVNHAEDVVAELDELFEAGFRGFEAKRVHELIAILDEAEHESDKREMHIRRHLKVVERDMPPLDAMFLYKVIDLIGELADVAQRVGSRLQVLMAR